MQMVAIPAVIYAQTDSATWLGVISVASLLPAVVLTPYAGALADRMSRRRILLMTQAAQMASAFTMWALWLAGALRPWPVLVVSLFFGVATGIQTSAWQSFVPLLVPRDDMLHAVRMNSMQYTLARAIGPGLAGLVLTLGGTGLAIFINAATYLLVIAALLVVRVRENVISATTKVGVQIREGFTVTRSTPVYLLVVTLAFVTSLVGQALQQQASAVAGSVFGREPREAATLLAAFGLGSVAASFGINFIGARVAPPLQTIGALTLYATGFGTIAASTVFVVGAIGFAIVGIAHLVMATVLNTSIQSRVSDELRGRVTSMYVLGVLAGIPIGSLVMGLIADAVGMRAALVLNVMVCCGLLGYLGATGKVRVLAAPPVPASPTT